MPGLVKYGSNGLAQFLDAPDVVYGTGDDGSVVFDGTTTILGMAPSSSVYSLTRDIYCYNMSVSDSVRIQPNGYRIFVQNLLTLGDASRIGWANGTGWSTAGTIQQGGAAMVSVTHSLGGFSDIGTATAPTSALGGANYYKQPHQAVRGFAITASGGPTYLRGGAGGTTGLGGGVIICAARYIACTATSTNATFTAEGGTGYGGGGVIIVISSGASLPANISTSVTGYLPGTYNYIQLV
jgi:hypothetical protein